jgi:hypothetical protein
MALFPLASCSLTQVAPAAPSLESRKNALGPRARWSGGIVPAAVAPAAPALGGQKPGHPCPCFGGGAGAANAAWPLRGPADAAAAPPALRAAQPARREARAIQALAPRRPSRCARCVSGRARTPHPCGWAIHGPRAGLRPRASMPAVRVSSLLRTALFDNVKGFWSCALPTALRLRRRSKRHAKRVPSENIAPAAPSLNSYGPRGRAWRHPCRRLSGASCPGTENSTNRAPNRHTRAVPTPSVVNQNPKTPLPPPPSLRSYLPR